DTHTATLTLIRDSSYTAAPAVKTDPGPQAATPQRGGPITRLPNLAAELRGTWEIMVTGPPSTVRVRRGAFQFTPQPDGEVLVSATFMCDGANCQLNGRANIVQSRRLFLKANITTSEGGSWTSDANFERTMANHLSGRLTVKNGDDVPIELQKIVK